MNKHGLTQVGASDELYVHSDGFQCSRKPRPWSEKSDKNSTRFNPGDVELQKMCRAMQTKNTSFSALVEKSAKITVCVLSNCYAALAVSKSEWWSIQFEES